ncbi:MAG: 5-formyltetrahydrofolate cyclo-ligase [Frankiales bacterium]|nr:5-formyltetrahydrofolate cyclo-ligase [Frankiales bacterium]
MLRRMAEQHRGKTGATSDLGPALAPLLSRSAQTASYVSLGTEPRIPPQPGWLLPVLLPDGDLDWAVDTGHYVINALGISEPAGPRLGVDAIATCDLVLVPALLVDRRGYRLGRGGGSYDRALARATGLTVALLHDGELVDELPHEPHDVRVRAVVTPSQGVVHLPA